MKLRKVSKILATTLFLSNLNLPSFAGILSEDGRYEAFEDESITIDDVLEEDEIDIEIEGNSILNSCKNDTSNSITIDKVTHFDASLIKPNREYTLIYEVTQNALSEGEKFIMELHGHIGAAKSYVEPGRTGLIVDKVNTYGDVVFINWIAGSDGTTTNRGSVTIKNVMVLEGDWSNKEIPQYFLGLKSSFEDNLITQEMVDSGREDKKNLGKYKAEIKVTGKNKLNIPSYFEKNLVWNGTGNSVLVGYAPLKPNTDYRIKAEYIKSNNQYDNGGIRLCMMNDIPKETDDWYLTQNNMYVHSTEAPYDNISMSFNSRNYKYFAIYVGVATDTQFNHTAILKNTQLEEGLSYTGYEPYKEEIKTLYLNEPLRAINDEVKDRIVKKNGQWMVERNCGEIVFDGSGKWELNETRNLFVYFFENKHLYGKVVDIATKPQMINNHGLSSISFEDGYSGVVDYGVTHGFNKSDRVCIRNIDYLYDLDRFKDYLSKNQLKLIYQLGKPVYKSIDRSILAQLFEDTTHIYNNSAIPTNMKVTIDRTANRAKEAINTALLNPSAENIQQARYWANLMKESTLKDKFQEQISTNTDIIDMNIEKKSTSANADVYVKLKNTLSLSLDTNNIIFNDVDSTQDTELKNAVNLTISSSLPYRVNAYLEGEIYNSDKTATLDKSTLNIKVNSDNDYKAFSNTTDPILLIDNHNEGVDISHGLDFMLSGGNTHKADVYKTTVKIEVEQK